MFDGLWQKIRGSGYRGNMGVGRQGRSLPPVRHLPELDKYQGSWVAVRDGRVIAHAQTSLKLVAELGELGEAGKGAVAQYVPKPSKSFMVGVG